MIGQKRSKMLLPVFFQAQIQKISKRSRPTKHTSAGPSWEALFLVEKLRAEGIWRLLRDRCSGSVPFFFLLTSHQCPSSSPENCGRGFGRFHVGSHEIACGFMDSPGCGDLPAPHSFPRHLRDRGCFWGAPGPTHQRPAYECYSAASRISKALKCPHLL